MVRIAWRMLTQRPASMIATFLALAVAVGVVTGCGVMLESGIRFHGTVARYAAAPVAVATTTLAVTEGSGADANTEHYPLSDRGPLPAALPAELAAAPGVRAAVTDTAVGGQVIRGTTATPIQLHPWSAAALTPYTLSEGVAPGEGDIVLDQSLARELRATTGEHVRLDLANGPRSFTVTGIAVPTRTAPAGAPTVFAADTQASALAGGVVQVIAVFGDRGRSTSQLATQVRAVVDGHAHRGDGAYPQVYTGADRGSVESLAVGNAREFAIAVSGTFGGCALIIAVLVIAGSVGLSVQQRHRDIALLRAIAATPRQVRRLVVRETIALWVLAAAAGVGPGLAAAGWLRDQFIAREMVPGDFELRISWLPPAVAAASGLLIAVIAVWFASLRASRIRPSQALAETAVERRGVGPVRALVGLIALAGGITLAAVSASATGDSAAGVAVGTVFTLVTAVALLGPLLIRIAAVVAAPLLRLFGVTGRLAAATTSTSTARLATVLSALVLAVGLGGSMWFMQSSEEHVAIQQAHAGLRADYVVTSAGPELRPALTTSLRATHGVRAAVGLVRSTWFTAHDGGTAYPIEGLDTDGISDTLDLDVSAGSITALKGKTIAVDTLTAHALHVHVGSRLPGFFGDGTPIDLNVVAIYRRGLGFAPITVPRDVLASHTGTGLNDVVLISVDTARSALPAQLRHQLATQAPGSALLAGSAYQVALDRDLVQNAWTEKVITSVLITYVAIATVNTLVTYALGRQREFAVLRLAGATRRQLRHMISLEQVLLLTLTLVLGLTIAAVTLIPMVKGTTGSATPYIPAAGWISVIGGVVVLASLATAVPARRALRTPPVAGIGIRE